MTYEESLRIAEEIAQRGTGFARCGYLRVLAYRNPVGVIAQLLRDNERHANHVAHPDEFMIAFNRTSGRESR